MTVSEKHREIAQLFASDLPSRIRQEHRSFIVSSLARVIATAEREGREDERKRCAEIARDAGQTHLDFVAMGLPVEPSKIIAEDRAKVANKIADRILSQAGEA